MAKQYQKRYEKTLGQEWCVARFGLQCQLRLAENKSSKTGIFHIYTIVTASALTLYNQVLWDNC